MPSERSTVARRRARTRALRGLGSLAVLVTGLVCLGAASAHIRATSSRAVSVAVVRCPTRMGITGSHRRVPTRITLDEPPSSATHLVAYTNTEDFLVGPAGMACSGAIGVDGTATILAWPQGSPEPRRHSHGAGLSLSVDPDCVGCQAELACPFFTAFARSLGFPCTDTIPSRERVDRIDTDLVSYQDPPGVSGDGWPSGGVDPANGVVALFGPRVRGRPEEVMSATCTLPAAASPVCTTSLNDAITRLVRIGPELGPGRATEGS